MLHHDQPIGFISVSPPALSNSVRNQVFNRSKISPKILNDNFVNISRVVLDPRYRGAGIAADFLRAVIAQEKTRFIELITSMRGVTRFMENAGFIYYGKCSGVGGGGQYGKMMMKKKSGEFVYKFKQSNESVVQSTMSNLYYYLFDRKRK